MDSSNDHLSLQDDEATTSSSSNDVYVTIEDIIAAFPRSRFLATYCRYQNFAFPFDSIIFYITKNPLSTKAYQKLIQSCKHFFVQNPIIVVSHLNILYLKSKMFYAYFDKITVEEINKISSKIWVTDILTVENHFNDDGVQDHFSKNIIPKIYQCDAKQLTLASQIITFNDFFLLASKSTYAHISNVTTKYENGAVVALEKIFEVLPKVKVFQFWLPKNSLNIIASKTDEGHFGETTLPGYPPTVG